MVPETKTQYAELLREKEELLAKLPRVRSLSALEKISRRVQEILAEIAGLTSGQA